MQNSNKGSNGSKKIRNKNKFRNKNSCSMKDDVTRDLGKSSDYNNTKFTGPNDLSWYVTDDQILHDAASIPYSIPVGVPYARQGLAGDTTIGTVDLQVAKYDHAIPGLCVSMLMPMLGMTIGGPNAPVNVAANSVYQNVRSHISGSRPYDAVDMMLYLGAMDSLYCYMTWLTRLYATVYTYHQSNRYLSKAIIEAQGVDYDDLVANLSSFRAAVNVYIAKARALYLPSILPIFRRHSWLFSHYYIEGDSEKDQIYMHVPAGGHVFTYDSDGAGMLKAFKLPDGFLMTHTYLLGILASMINPIYADEDFNRISGDMLKTYEGNVFTLTEIPDIATIQLIHSEEVLLQFKNAKYKYVQPNSNGNAWLDNFFDYYQASGKKYLSMDGSEASLNAYISIGGANNIIIPVDSSSADSRKVTLLGCQNEWSKDTLLTTPHFNVSDGENMINTRLTLSFNVNKSVSSFTGYYWGWSYYGSEWPIEYKIYTFHRLISDGSTSLFWRRYDRVAYLSDSSSDTMMNWVTSQEPIRSAFKYLPELTILYLNSADSHLFDNGRPIFEVDNYALVDSNIIFGLHRAAIMGEYNIPKLSIGR